VHQTDDNLLRDEIKTSILTLLDTLEEDERQIIELYYLDELSIKEVSTITNFSESNVKVKLHRARKTLSLHINQYLDHE
jgi:RNA polymerase sigma-70 factor (ECF subfamily)